MMAAGNTQHTVAVNRGLDKRVGLNRHLCLEIYIDNLVSRQLFGTDKQNFCWASELPGIKAKTGDFAVARFGYIIVSDVNMLEPPWEIPSGDREMLKHKAPAALGASKQCYRCKVIKDTGEFHLYSRSHDGLQPYCRPCKRMIDNEHYKKYPRRNYERNRANVRRNQLWLHNFIKTKQCEWEGCTVHDPDMLVLDHINPSEKRQHVSNMVHKPFSLKSLQEEVAKCRVLCANHHQKHTIQQFGYKKWLVKD